MANSVPNVTQLFGTTLYQDIPMPEEVFFAAVVKPIELHDGENPYAKARIAIERWNSKASANISTYANLTVFGKSALTFHKYVAVGNRFLFIPNSTVRIGVAENLEEGNSLFVDYTSNRIVLLPNKREEVDVFAGDAEPETEADY